MTEAQHWTLIIGCLTLAVLFVRPASKALDYPSPLAGPHAEGYRLDTSSAEGPWSELSTPAETDRLVQHEPESGTVSGEAGAATREHL